VDHAALSQLSRDDLIALLLTQEARIAELERRLGLNSANSGKPPSSDGLKKLVRVGSLREASGRKTGGQPGHPGKTLSRTEAPDARIDHFPQICAGCGAALSEVMAMDHTARQVFDLPEPKPLVVTEHRAHLLLPGLRHTNPFGFSRRRHRPDPVWRAARSVRAVSAELPIASREAAGHADGRPFRR
jgi:hypothetical protein